MKKHYNTTSRKEVVFNLLLEAGYILAFFLLAATLYSIFF
jgi:hypothetical protein